MKNTKLSIVFTVLNLIEISLFTILLWIYIPLTNNILDKNFGHSISKSYENDSIGLLLVIMVAPIILGILFSIKRMSKNIKILSFNYKIPLIAILYLLFGAFTSGILSDIYIVSGWIVIINVIIAIIITTIITLFRLIKSQ